MSCQPAAGLSFVTKVSPGALSPFSRSPEIPQGINPWCEGGEAPGAPTEIHISHQNPGTESLQHTHINN